MDSIKGIVDRVIYNNRENSYTVADIDVDGSMVTVVGYFTDLREGVKIHAEGEYINHHVYGSQLKVSNYNIETPKDADSILTYLSSGMVTGIGSKKAEDIVAAFGDEALDVIENDPIKLATVKGIGKKTALIASATYKAQAKTRDIVIELGKFGIKPQYAMKLYKEYKGDTLDVVKNNPYALIDDVYGIGFKRADAIALSAGFERDSAYRVRSGILYLLGFCYQNGNTYVLKERLIDDAVKLLSVEHDIISYNLSNMFLDDTVYLETVGNESRCFLPKLYEAEVESANMLKEINNTFISRNNEKIDFKSFFDSYEKLHNVKLDYTQKQAVESSISSKVSVITGGPGTGKTTIINVIIYILASLGHKYLLAAPTGRAAKRMSEQTGSEAKTIHRLLEYSYMGEGDEFLAFGKNEDNKLDADFIILDEMSMVDITLLSSFLKAVGKETSIIFVGDVDQLPSVGAGDVLADLIKSGLAKVTRLDTIYRQEEGSMIVLNAHEINKGNYPKLSREADDFFFVDTVTQPKIKRRILGIVENYKDNPLKDFDIKKDVQIISPLKKGEAGVYELNNSLQFILNPQISEDVVTYGGYTFKENDKVMQIRNNYLQKWKNPVTDEKGAGIYNGDMGIIKKVNSSAKTITVRFDDDRESVYPFEQINELTLSYAITVHKSQGSEFPAVIIPVFSGFYGFLTRNLLYTAITRAKNMVILIGEKNALEGMIRTVSKDKRNTALAERLRAE